MTSFIALFFPAAISVEIFHVFQAKEEKRNIFLFIEYAVWNALINTCTSVVLYYGLRHGESITEDLQIYTGFFMHFMIIALVFATVLPIVARIFNKYFSIKFEVKERDEK